MVTPQDALHVITGRYGTHAGFRALHAKGILCRGSFTATPAAAALSRAAHLSGERIEVTARFSNAAGDPAQPDYVPDPRGLAVKFYLPDGTRTDLVAQSVPHFPVATPDAFLELLRAGQPGLANAWRLPWFLARHPAALRSAPANVAALRPPESYASCSYYGVHAFRWVSADGSARFVRSTLVPAAGEHRLTVAEARSRGRDFLTEELRARLVREPVRFDLRAVVAVPGDPVEDPSARWPLSRQTVIVGTLELTGLEENRETGGDVLVFDPTRVTDGIELSDDPVLRFRSPAYSASVAQRTATH